MSVDDAIKETIREVFREELESLMLDDRLLTAEQVAEKLAYTNVDSVRRLAREGHLEAVNLGNNTRRFRNSDVQRIIQQGLRCVAEDALVASGEGNGYVK